ncbi:calcium-binding protein [Actinoplanes sp. RD1]|uniref:calcium-binding protein n=1 Tax=Actinoplanes sp. RD1 TaxID=3064538 RepID=UPI0027411376|nr:calcium-binding protein [Actinoplanes sp. RD1]
MRRFAGLSLLATASVAALTATPAQAATTGVASVVETMKVVYKAAQGKQNKVVVTRSGRTIIIDDVVAVKAGKGCAAVKGDKTKVRCTPKKDPTWIRVYTYDRNDSITNKSGLGGTLDGGSAKDSIVGGPRGERLTGGTGNDKIWANGGNDTIWGGDGSDLVHGGAGDDDIIEESHNPQSGNDWLYGDDGHDHLNGDAGADHLYGGNDEDFLSGDRGADVLSGGYGNDIVFADEDFAPVTKDAMDGGPGLDDCRGDKPDKKVNCEGRTF